MTEQRQRLQVLCGGIFSLLLSLGVARFAYTPLLPLMQEQAGLGIRAAGWLAAINYAGYLCGALAASFIGNLALKDRLYRAGMAIAVAPRIRPPAILPPCRMPGFSLIWTPTLSAIAPTVELISNPAW